jgi:hypothetical protein
MEAVSSWSGRKHTGGWKKRLSTSITQIYNTLDMVKYKWKVGIELSRILGYLEAFGAYVHYHPRLPPLETPFLLFSFITFPQIVIGSKKILKNIRTNVLTHPYVFQNLLRQVGPLDRMN